MNPDASIAARPGLLRHSSRDALLVGLALLHGALLVLMPSVSLIALGLWWNANTISHNFVHLPFFRSRTANVGFAAYLSLLLGFPQSLWAARHLAHHRDEPFCWRPVRRVWLAEGALVLALWAVLLTLAPKFCLAVYLPGWLLGLGLCHLQGRFEHLRGAVSHYGRLYNWLFFNDGFHVEHHAQPARHWTALPKSREAAEPNVSRWPAVLRWIERADKVAESETAQPRAAMKALALFGTLVVAKLLAVAGRDLPISAWTPLALFWQDALVAFVFVAVEIVLRKRPAMIWSLFWLITGYVAVNVVLTRVLSSPLTWPMSRAAGGALADSIRHYLTPGNLALMAAVLLSAGSFSAAALRLLRPIPVRFTMGIFAVLALAGAFAARQVDCGGLHRNALVAFVDSTLPQVRGVTPAARDDWRASTADQIKSVEDLTSLRGAAAGRNVILIALESTAARSLRSYGAKEDPMPNLTRLAATSLLFENVCSVYPESIKGLFSVLCSRYPAFDTRAEDYARIRTPSIAEVLADEGCRTALFHSGRFEYLGMNAVIQRRGFETLADAGNISGNFNSSFGVDEPATVERMLAWIDARPRGERFFLHYLPIAGHHPYATPERGPFPDSNDAGQYLNALHFGDAALGKFLDGLRARGLDTNTLFVIYGDHGEAFGQHEGNYGHTLFLYEENIRVPLLIALPGAWHAATRVQRTASLIDLAPTLLDLLGLKAPADYQGGSLLEPRPRAALFYTDYSQPLAGIRDGRWKLIAELGSSRVKLFDLETDPLETRNVAGQYPERVANWRRRLDDWTAAQKALVLQPDRAPRPARTRGSAGADGGSPL